MNLEMNFTFCYGLISMTSVSAVVKYWHKGSIASVRDVCIFRRVMMVNSAGFAFSWMMNLIHLNPDHFFREYLFLNRPFITPLILISVNFRKF